jgi:hypothetical protein
VSLVCKGIFLSEIFNGKVDLHRGVLSIIAKWVKVMKGARKVSHFGAGGVFGAHEGSFDPGPHFSTGGR